jgi:hypothetical protein
MTSILPRSAPIDDPVFWSKEGADQGIDPDSGAAVYRLTSGPAMNHLIYCEQPYTSPDGRRVAVIRSHDFTHGGTFALLAVEPNTLRSARVERAIPAQIAHSAYREWLYYGTHEGALRRVSLLTLVKEPVLPEGSIDPALDNLSSVSPDGRTLFIERKIPGTARYQIDTLSIAGGERRTIFTDPDATNAHLQCEPGDGARVLMQLVAHREGQPTRVPVLTMGPDGSGVRRLPIGDPRTAESTGHMAWVAGARRVACAVGWDREARRHDPRHPRGNLVIAGETDASPRVFAAPEHGFYHVSVSRCGRYFIADDFMDFRADLFGETGRMGPTRVVIGNLETGRYRVLIRDCQLQGIAGSSSWEPDPYLTADNRYAIFNASPFGTNQVFAARLAEDFLKSLG